MKKKRNKIKTIITILLFLSIMFIASVYAILKQPITIIGKANIAINDDEKQDYVVTYIIQNKWYSNGKYYYQISMTLYNNTAETLNGWKIQIDIPNDGEILSYYNVDCTTYNNIAIFENISYNAEVPGNSNVTFQFQIATQDAYYEPGNIIINEGIVMPPDIPEEPEETEIKVELNKGNSWNDGEYYYQLYTAVITNTGNATVNKWQFDLSEECIVEQVWNANLINNVTISNSEYNGTIQKGDSTSIGFMIKTTTPNIQLEAINIIAK